MMLKLFVVLMAVCALVGFANGAAMLDPTRCLAGTDSPTTDYVTNGTNTYSTATCLIDGASNAATLVLDGTTCTDYLPSAGEEFTWQNGTIKNPSHVQTDTSGIGHGTDPNGTAIAMTHGGNITELYPSGMSLCKIAGSYTVIQGYRDMGAFGGDYYRVPYAAWEVRYAGYSPNATNISEFYTFAIVPDSVNLGGTYSAQITSSEPAAPGAVEITINYVDSYGQTQPMKDPAATTAIASYTKIGADWFAYSTLYHDYVVAKGTVMPTSVSTMADMGVGTFIFTCNIRMPDNVWYSLTDSLVVGEGAAVNTTQKLTIEAKDYLTGALVSGTDFNVLNKASTLWSNVTAVGGKYDFWLPYNTQLDIEAVAGGYATAKKNWTVTNVPVYDLWMIMYAGETPAATNVSMSVNVLDGNTMNLMPNVNVRLNDGQVKTTSNAGVATFTVLAAKTYQIIASYPGYQSGSRTFTTGTGGISQEVAVIIYKSVITTAPSLPPGVTAQVTVDTRTDQQKDNEMMGIIRTNAPLLIEVAILMTLMYMLGYKP
jgi:hypothetical protein